MILGLNKLCGRPWWMRFKESDGLAIEGMMSIWHIEDVLCLCREISAVNSISVLGTQAPQELQTLKVGLIGIEGGFEQKLLFTRGRAQEKQREQDWTDTNEPKVNCDDTGKRAELGECRHKPGRSVMFRVRHKAHMQFWRGQAVIHTTISHDAATQNYSSNEGKANPKSQGNDRWRGSQFNKISSLLVKVERRHTVEEILPGLVFPWQE